MLRKTNKKGFTMVELVIVIAVIAILAAVLIPTFISLVRKANIANDTAVARNLNTAAITANADDFESALAAANEAGYLISSINATAEDCYIVWEDDSNQFLLYDLKEMEVIYSNTEEYGDPDNSWCFAVNSDALAATILAKLPNVTIKKTVVNTTELNNSINANGENTVYVDSSLEIDENSTIILDNKDAKTTIDLGSTTVSGNNNGTPSIDNVPFKVTAGELTLKGGVLSATGDMYDADGNVINVVVRATGSNTALVLEGTAIKTGSDAAIPVAISDFANVTIKDTEIISGNNVIQPSNGSKVSIINSKIECDYLAVFCSSSGGTASEVTIDGGTYHSTVSNLLGVHGGKIVVKSGTFNCDNPSKTLKFYNVDGGQIILEGGTFNGTAFANLDEAKIRSMCNLTDAADGVDVEKVDGAWVITVK